MRAWPIALLLLLPMSLEADKEARVETTVAQDRAIVRELLLRPPRGELSQIKDSVEDRVEDPALTLMHVASDPTNDARVRIIAIALLSEFPEEPVKLYLRQMAASHAEHPTFRGWALQSYARGFSGSEPGAVRSFISPFLSDLEPGLRARAEMSMEYIVAVDGTHSDPMKPIISILLED
jgi:hypothetical protein